MEVQHSIQHQSIIQIYRLYFINIKWNIVNGFHHTFTGVEIGSQFFDIQNLFHIDLLSMIVEGIFSDLEKSFHVIQCI